jgi:polyferredoxin
LIVCSSVSILNSRRRKVARIHRKGLFPSRESPWGFELQGEHKMITILLVILVLMLLGALPTWPYSRGWGYYPSGGLGLVVVILLALFLLGRI